MKHFFMEYGKIIVVGALTVTGLMFTTPFVEAVTGSVANFTTGMSSKYEPKELIDGDNVVLTDNDGNGVASKGDYLTFKTSYLYAEGSSGPTKFLVLKTDGSTAELLATTNYQNSVFNTSSVTTRDSAGQTVQKYEGSTLDTLLNTTYYNSLSDIIKSKIKAKEITQNTWQMNNTPANATVSAFNGSTITYKKTGIVGTYERKVYALDIQDVIDYLGTFFTGAQLNTMFFGTSEMVYEFACLRSGDYVSSDAAFRVNGASGILSRINYDDSSNEARPSFTITLREGFF